ncbi:hypothetical protein EXU29_01685 [Acinetobacter wuhouensis]|uniref:hypothetical protein n=1 Tax=Acinetobacter wuhouensis TaxID=1879050 RepID=UPI00102367C5|nr:hypothetical protein [Acinetobacter wuhouensis]RZG75596.1 hypothetical protein EXU29_01685 [Acinetobacter wuhouensis]
MDDKKIYQLLQAWFPELESLKIPKKKMRRDFETFYYWLSPQDITEPTTEDDLQEYKYRGYFLSIDRDQHFDNGIEVCALFQDLNVDVEAIQNRIELRTAPLFEHYEKYKDLIGNFYALRSHVYDIVLEEIYNEVRKHGYRMLLIYASEQIWMAVPDQQKKIAQFIKLFRKQFIGSRPSIEYYERFKPFNLSSFLSDDD